ncbi:MAG TPA: hypothetical protein VGH11_12370, partial [Jatrophihabitans sp.]
AAYSLDADPNCSGTGDLDEQAIGFDETDGAHSVVEPDPFAEPALTPLRHPSLRAEFIASPAGPIARLARPGLPPLPVLPALAEILPYGLRRGSTIAVTSSVSLLLALLGEASAHGAWTAMVGMPALSAEAADEAGMDLDRLAIIRPPDDDWTGASWTTAVGALLDAVDVVVARPGSTSRTSTSTSTPGISRVSDGDARRLMARARSKDAVLVLFGQQAANWPSVEVQLSAQHSHWTGIGDGYGRITARRLSVSATGRGRSARPRHTDLWLPIGTEPISTEPISTEPIGTEPVDADLEQSAPIRLSVAG